MKGTEKNPTGMHQVAEHIIAVANEEGIPISNMHLQRVLFFTFGFMVSEDRMLAESIYDEPFRRWSYGPTVESIYFSFHHFGGRPIEMAEAKPRDDFRMWDGYIKKLLQINGFQLAEFSLRLPSFSRYSEQVEHRDWVPPYVIEDFTREFRKP